MKYVPSLCLTALILFISNLARAQKVEIVTQSTFHSQKRDKRFAFIERTTEMKDIKYVATLKVTGKKYADIDRLYYKVKDKAQILGANSFKIKNFEKNETTREHILILDTYYASDSAFQVNANNHEKNVVYLFGDSKLSHKSYSFKEGDVKKELRGDSLFKYSMEKGDNLKLIDGGSFLGATVSIDQRKKESKPIFIGMDGFRLSKKGTANSGGRFSTGDFVFVDENMGYFYAKLLEQINTKAKP